MNYLPLLLRPLILIAFLALVAFLSSLVRRAIPAGRIKRVLTRPMHLIPQTEEDRRDWRPVIICVVLAALLWGGVAWMISAA